MCWALRPVQSTYGEKCKYVCSYKECAETGSGQKIATTSRSGFGAGAPVQGEVRCEFQALYPAELQQRLPTFSYLKTLPVSFPKFWLSMTDDPFSPRVLHVLHKNSLRNS